jgi:hypothetical protein
VSTRRDRFTHRAGYVLEYLVDEPPQRSSPYLHVLFHGFSAIERHVPPVFARKQWRDWESSVCLFLSDPIHLVTPDSGCGWFLLGEDEFMPRIFELQQDLLARFGLQGTVWHGLSSGGYAALKHCVRSEGEGLAFVVSPHNDPTILPQWTREAVPYLDQPGWGEPTATVDTLARWSSAKYLHAMLSEKDAYFGVKHLQLIVAALDGWKNFRALALRDGRGHGFIADVDYETQLAAAIRDWESYRRTFTSADTERSTSCAASK